MTDEQINNLDWKVYQWMIDEHYLPGQQLIIFSFIHEYSGNKDIATIDILDRLFVHKGYTRFMLEHELTMLICKGLIDENQDPDGKRFYSVPDAIKVIHNEGAGGSHVNK